MYVGECPIMPQPGLLPLALGLELSGQAFLFGRELPSECPFLGGDLAGLTAIRGNPGHDRRKEYPDEGQDRSPLVTCARGPDAEDAHTDSSTRLHQCRSAPFIICRLVPHRGDRNGGCRLAPG